MRFVAWRTLVCSGIAGRRERRLGSVHVCSFRDTRVLWTSQRPLVTSIKDHALCTCLQNLRCYYPLNMSPKKSARALTEHLRETVVPATPHSPVGVVRMETLKGFTPDEFVRLISELP